jgi:thiol-disulfide isomerase/thioredoxin
MKTIEPDDRGIVRACPQCGQRNRLIYERLGSVFRCSKCRTEIPPPAEPVEVPGAAKFDSLIARSALPVLVDVWAPWCGHCKMVAPELAKVAADGAGRWLVAKVNTDELLTSARALAFAPFLRWCCLSRTRCRGNPERCPHLPFSVPATITLNAN